MLTFQQCKDEARVETRQLLARSPRFRNLTDYEQRDMYRNVFQASLNRLLGEQRPRVPAAPGLGRAMTTDPIDDGRHASDRMDGLGEQGADFIREVDFPRFVSDLLTGVYDANLELMDRQTESYWNLLKEAQRSTEDFAAKTSDADGLNWLLNNNEFQGMPVEFNENGDLQSIGGGPPQLTDGNGNPLDIGSNELRDRLAQAKLALAEERRLLMREMLLMGINRIVVDEGTVRASVIFDVQASESITRTDQDMTQSSGSGGGSGSGQVNLGIIKFGGGGGGKTKSSRVRVSSAKSQNDASLAAQITGFVEIKFSSDYFALDNFASMPVTWSARGNAGQAGAPAAAAPGAV